ncbi:hypothetical protein BB737_17070 [Mycobacterium avium subsp. hominissuis]|uniref:Uncharacterized protein n=1 Tax=Mycobacterium paraffinicum TaxID=53378 RepID=A0ABP8RDG6_9MYCO|nr:hypothetical protein O982_24725 [Mycobacterium avium 10-5581]PBJ36296.1 hypothetical protein BI294_12910 [Mycobacterium avium subsp. hominissuis]PBJ64620.1 hypothetical protein BB737_17070 [Mycobacterium avium subsp. hominissuis]BAN91843.1 hypothetical protein MAH_p11 [Mycobacterium avium subsp. hominissuis TH135]
MLLRTRRVRRGRGWRITRRFGPPGHNRATHPVSWRHQPDDSDNSDSLEFAIDTSIATGWYQ